MLSVRTKEWWHNLKCRTYVTTTTDSCHPRQCLFPPDPSQHLSDTSQSCLCSQLKIHPDSIIDRSCFKLLAADHVDRKSDMWTSERHETQRTDQTGTNTEVNHSEDFHHRHVGVSNESEWMLRLVRWEGLVARRSKWSTSEVLPVRYKARTQQNPSQMTYHEILAVWDCLNYTTTVLVYFGSQMEL